MDQHISLRILRIIVVMTHDYLISCNAPLLIYRGLAILLNILFSSFGHKNRSQKSRVFWLREWDRNTKFFHALTKQRRARNKITQLLDANENIVEDEEGLVAIATSYFR